MRSHFIVMASPDFDEDASFGAATKPFHAQAFVAELAVEAYMGLSSERALVDLMAGMVDRFNIFGLVLGQLPLAQMDSRRTLTSVLERPVTA